MNKRFHQVRRRRLIIMSLSIILLLMAQIATLQATSLHASSPQPLSISPYQNNELITENNNASTDAPQTVDTLPEHPRVYVRAADISEIRARYTHADLAYTKYLLEKQINQENDGWSDSGRAEVEIRRGIEARAFLYLIYGDADAGEKAVEMMLDFLRSIDQPHNGSTSRARELYDSMIAAAMVYDWCYDLLSNSERTAIIEGIYKVAGLSEYGWPLSGNISYLTSHFTEHASVATLAAGIAIFDEDPEMFQIAYDRFVNGLVPSRNGYYPMGKHHQGTHYAVTRFFHEIHSTLLFNKIDLPNIYSDKQATVPYHMLYARTPSGRFLTEGDVAVPDNIDARIQILTAQIYDDPYLMNDGISVSDEGDLGTLRDAARTFIFWDPTVAVRPINELPVARYFPSPSGSMVARTGWDLDGGKQSNVAMAIMNVGEYHFGNHAHLDSGHFGFYYKGTLALDSGTYSGNTGQYNSAHSRNYYQRTIAHNSLLIEDPNEPYTLHYGSEVDSRDGGQYRPNQGREWESIRDMFANGKHAQVLARELGAGDAPEYTYLKGDLTPGYNAPAQYNYPPKATEVKRSFVFLDLKNNLHPAALIVFDKVTSTNAEFKKRWLVHSVERPAVSGSRVTINHTADGNNGRMVNDVLWPEADNRIIKRVGGEGKEFLVDDENYPNRSNEPSVESGSWRIEVLPIEDTKTDLFLNVMHVMDANGGPAPLATQRLDSERMIGALIANRAVFFSKDAAPIADEFTITADSDLSLINVLVTDLQPGQWYVHAGNQVQELTASADGKSIYFSAAPGSYTLSREQIQPAATNTPQPTATNTPQPTATDTPQPTATDTPQPTATDTPQPTATDTPQPTATDTPQPTATDTPQPTATDTPQSTATDTPQPTATDTPQPAATDTPQPTATDTPQPTATDTPQPTATDIPVATPTPWPTVAVPTATPRPTIDSSSGYESFQETFEGISGIINGVDEWNAFRSYVETIPSQDVYQGLSLSRENAHARRPLPIGIKSGSRGTLHFRFKRTGDADISIGLSDIEFPTEFSAYEVQFGSQFGLHSKSAPNNFMSRDGNEARNLENRFVVNEWHCVWLVIDNAANNFKGYVLGGAYSEITPLSVNGQTTFAFRHGTNDRLQTFYARTGWDSAKVFIDDIYLVPNEVNPSSNTSSCQAGYTPEPTIEPTVAPTIAPTVVSTVQPTVASAIQPTAASTVQPTAASTVQPTAASTVQPTIASTVQPTATQSETLVPTITPTSTSTPELPSATAVPTNTMPTVTPTTEDPNNSSADDNGSITGRVFIDENRNGQYDLGETAVPDILVILTDDSTEGQTLTITIETDENGIYHFTNMPSDDYVISFSLPSEYNVNGGSNFLVRTNNSDNIQGPDLRIIQGTSLGMNNISVFLPIITQ